MGMKSIYPWSRMIRITMSCVIGLLINSACCSEAKEKYNNIEIIEQNGLVIYQPQFGRVDLICKDMPSDKDKTVLMCCEAAFTGQLLKEFKHSNIAGNHVSSGIYHNGYRCIMNTGCFAYYADTKTWEFAMGSYNSKLIDAKNRNGCGFGQLMMIHNGAKQQKQAQKAATRNEYRVLAEYKGKLCVIDSKGSMRYGDFVDAMLRIGVRHALYLDMGGGWNYSYYRDNNDKVHYIHDHRIKYTTNWITFYK